MAPAPPPPPSSWLPLCPLGSGSSSLVSLALNLADSSLFAAKCSPSVTLLLHELHLLQSLHSPFIIQCLGCHFPLPPPPPPTAVSTTNHLPLPCLFLEYMDRGSLANILRRSPGGRLRDENLVQRYTRSIVQGLGYLHQNGVVHCDIKSHNILVGQSGVKIGDFGAARRKAGAEATTIDPMPRGTPLWMAPEALRGEDQGTPSDIWSLGCTVVEMLQGRPPWGHLTSLEALLLKVGTSDEDPPLPESISAEAKDFLLRCLCRDPTERATAAELLQHPFLCGWEEEAEADASNKNDQPSPRSTLAFVYSSDSDCECESVLSSSPVLSSLRNTGPPSPAREESTEGREWITVRRAERYRKIDQAAPFLNSDEALQVRKACEVRFDSATFLMKKRRTRVG